MRKTIKKLLSSLDKLPSLPTSFSAVPLSIPSPLGGQIIELLPDSGKYGGGWTMIHLRLEGDVAAIEQARLHVHSKLGDREFDFNVKLESAPTGKVDMLAKFLGTIQKLQLEIIPASKKVTVSKFSFRSLNKYSAAIRLVLPEIPQLLKDRKELAYLSQDLVVNITESGWRGGLACLRQRFLHGAVCFKNSYDIWNDNYNVLPASDKEAIRGRIAKLAKKPLISVIVPVYNTDERWLRKAIDSVRGQLYPHWELCIADDLSTKPHVREVLESYAKEDERIKLVYREKNGHISAASNSALALATGDYVAFLDHDDELTEDALYWVAEEINQHPKADLIYSDEDKIDVHGRTSQPHFKTKWNWDLLYSINLVTHLAVYRRKLVNDLGGLRVGFEGSQDYDLVLRVAEATKPERIRHIPKVLYHWRTIAGSTAIGPEGKSYAAYAACRAIQEHFNRTGKPAKVIRSHGNFNRVLYDLPDPLPLVSLIICTRDRVDLLKGIVQGILEKTNYKNFELIIVDNQSEKRATLDYFKRLKSEPKVRVIKYDHPFNFSGMNNWAAEKAKGSLVGFLNNDLLVIEGDWLHEMVRFAQRPEIGAVGAKLYYANETIQHAGVILGIGGVAGHAHKTVPRGEGGYMSRAFATQSFSAVTGACLFTKRDLFQSLGGFDEVNLPVAFSDIDYCLKVRGEGLRVVYTPYAELYHLESATRGSDQTDANFPRFQRELNFMIGKWKNELLEDPFYSPNLTLEGEDWAFAFPPRVAKPWEPAASRPTKKRSSSKTKENRIDGSANL